jgi:hypothetical protein
MTQVWFREVGSMNVALWSIAAEFPLGIAAYELHALKRRVGLRRGAGILILPL